MKTYFLQDTKRRRIIVFVSLIFGTECVPNKSHSKTRMHSSRMRTARSSGRLGGCLHQAPPRSRHPLGADTPPPSRHPQTRHPPQEQTAPPPQPSRHPPVHRMTDACENITLPQLRCGR